MTTIKKLRGRRAVNPLIDGKRTKKPPPPPNAQFASASFFQLMRYANAVDYCVLALGIASGVVVGGALPFNELMFADLSDALIAAERNHRSDRLDTDAFLSGIKVYLLCYIAATVSMMLCGFVSVLCFHALCERQVHIIRCRLFRAIVRQSAAWFDRTEVGALTQKMNAGIEQMQAGLGDKCAFILHGVVSVVVGCGLALSTSWRLTLVVLVAVPLLLYTLYAANAASDSGARNEMGIYAAAGVVANEVLGAIRTVAAFNAQDFELNRYGTHLRAGRVQGIRRAVSVALFSGLNLLVLFAMNGVVFWYGTKLLFDYDRPLITPGMLFGVFWMLMLGMIRLGEAIPHLGTIAAARLAAGEILAIIDESEAEAASSSTPLCCRSAGLKPSGVEGRIELRGVSFSYPTRPDICVLDELSLTVEPGESVALVGSSGCGKSTIVSLLLRFYAPSAGSIRIDGTPIELLDLEWLRTSAIGVVTQEPVIFATTIEENMRLGKMDATMEEIMDACRQANAHDFIAKLPNGYRTPIGIGGVRLSGGQRQRLAIARALLRRPRILLLDEATSALDGESERLVQVALDRARHGRTTLSIAHRLSTIRNADRIIVLERGGRIVECGTHEELMARSGGAYRQMAAAQHLDACGSHADAKSSDDFPPKEPSEAVSSGSIIPNEEDDEEGEETEDSDFSTKPTLTVAELGGTKNEAQQPPSTQKPAKRQQKRHSILTALRYMGRAEVSLVIVAALFAILMGSAWPLFSIVYGRMFSALSAVAGGRAAATAAVQENALFFIALGAIATVSTFASGALLSYVGETFSMRIRMTVFKNLLRQDSAFYDDSRHSVGKLTARLAVDARNVQAAVDQRLAGAIGALTSLLLGVLFAFHFDWSLAGGGLATITILFAIELVVLHVLKRGGTVDVTVAEHSANIACEAIENVRTVQALVREDHLCEIFNIASKCNRQRTLFRGFFQSILYGLNYAFAQILFSVTYSIGVMMVVRMTISPFVVFQVTESLISAAFAVMRFAAYLPEYLRARLSAAQMATMIARRAQIDALGEGGSAEPIRGELEVRDVRFAYPTRQQHAVLDGLSFRATAGATVALVGQSGCGKTTVIQLLERFYDVGAGSIRVDGVDVREYNVGHLRAAIALVSQEPTLFNLSIRDNIAYGMRGDETSIMDAARMANVDEFVQRLPMKYDTLVGGKGAQLSGGQRQRIAIARAIARQPRILLLDEATSALDANSEKAVQEAMDSARVGRTCVVIAHRLSTIRNADLIVVMDGGRVAESGTHAELVARGGQYARLVAAGGTATDAASP